MRLNARPTSVIRPFSVLSLFPGDREPPFAAAPVRSARTSHVVRDPALQRRFRHFAESPEPDPSLAFVKERGQRRPADWPRAPAPPPAPAALRAAAEWVPVASAAEVPTDGGIAVRYGETQLALFHVAATDSWYATENRCPHTRDAVLARGIVGDQRGRPKVACPLHKKTFDLETGAGLWDPELCVAAFPARAEDGKVLVKLPPPALLAQESEREATAR